MSNFAISSTAKKATKNSAYNMAVKLKKGDSLSDRELDSLILYFAPSLPKKATSAFQWAAKAAANNAKREYLNYVRVQDGYAYGCDGARMHKAAIDLPEGYYCPKTQAAVPLTIEPPNYERVMARTKNEGTPATLGELTKGIFRKRTYLVHVGLECAAHENQLIDGLNSQDHSATFEYEQYNDAYRIHGTNEFGAFVLMPLKECPK